MSEKALLNDLQRSVKRLEYMLTSEKPKVYPDEKIALIRTVSTVPEIFTREEMEEIRKNHYIHEQGKVCNINPDYGMLLNVGFDQKREEIKGLLSGKISQEHREYLEALLTVMDLIQAFAERYRASAVEVGNAVVAETFSKIPAKAPETLTTIIRWSI